jgi:hypothetical protein
VGHGQRRAAGGPGQPAVALVAGRFRTGDERYQWLTRVQVVGRGEMSPDGRRLDYEFYELR